jgi:DNA-binding transcriptional regulator YiaG
MPRRSSAPLYQTPRRTPATASYTLQDLFRIMRADAVHMSDVATALNTSRQCLYYWKSGRSAPSILSVEEMAAELGGRLVFVRNDD